MNTIDTKVLRQLMERGRTTWAELGALLGLSAPARATVILSTYKETPALPVKA